jgi:hypothetical protein
MLPRNLRGKLCRFFDSVTAQTGQNLKPQLFFLLQPAKKLPDEKTKSILKVSTVAFLK